MRVEGEFADIKINEILPNRFQPRIHFDEKKLNQLATSIYEYGVIQPIIVRRVNNKYEIISGERRYKASKLANKETIPAIIVNLSDRESEEIALLENVQRQDLTPIEEAVSYKRILDSGYLTQEELAKKLGKSQPTIANKVRLLNLDDEVQEALLHGKISERHARSLLKLTDRKLQRNMLERIINERLTVRKTDEEISKKLNKVVKPVENYQNNINEKPKILESSSDAEMLFDNLEEPKKEERKEGFMDIDKIMREAKDINAPEVPNDISQLMHQDPSIQASQANMQKPANMMPPLTQKTPTPSQTIINDDNKFVHYMPAETQPIETPKPQNTTGVSFNSIFNSTPADLVSNEPIKQPSNFEQTSPQPIKPENVSATNSSNLVENPNNSIASAVSAAFKAAENSPKNEEIKQTEISSINSNNVANQVTGVSIPSFPDTPVTNTSVVNELNTLKSDESLFGNNFETSQTQNNVENSINSISEPLQNVQPQNIENVSSPVNTTPVTNIPALDTPMMNINNESNKTPNIPQGDIFEDSQEDSIQNVQPSMISPTTKSVNVNNFSNIIHLIRDCADKIEALGYNINLDEVDLDNNYKVTFTINK